MLVFKLILYEIFIKNCICVCVIFSNIIYVLIMKFIIIWSLNEIFVSVFCMWIVWENVYVRYNVYVVGKKENII